MLKTVDRKINWNKLLLAFLIATFIFCFGLFLGYLTKVALEGTAVSIEESTRNEIVNLETLFLLEKDYPCDSSSLDVVAEKMDYLGQMITLLESKKGKFDSNVLELKKLYTILEIRHMILIKERGEKCEKNYSIFFFFYSNSDECKNAVDKTSFDLSYLRNKYDSVRVYSFDINLKSDIISVLKKRYDVAGCRSVVLNENLLNGTIADVNYLESLI